VLIDRLGHDPVSARNVINRQEAEIAARVERGQPLESFLRSIELSPSTTRVLPESELRALEQKQARAAPEAAKDHSPMPATEDARRIFGLTPVPSRDVDMPRQEQAQPVRTPA
jgi:hypothetical protein